MEEITIKEEGEYYVVYFGDKLMMKAKNLQTVTRSLYKYTKGQSL